MSYVAVASARPQLAFGLGRPFGTAPERNRARRRLRAAFATAWPAMAAPAAGAYLVTADRSVLSLGFDRIVAAVRVCLEQVSERSRGTAAGAISGGGTGQASGPGNVAGARGGAAARGGLR